MHHADIYAWRGARHAALHCALPQHPCGHSCRQAGTGRKAALQAKSGAAYENKRHHGGKRLCAASGGGIYLCRCAKRVFCKRGGACPGTASTERRSRCRAPGAAIFYGFQEQSSGLCALSVFGMVAHPPGRTFTEGNQAACRYTCKRRGGTAGSHCGISARIPGHAGFSGTNHRGRRVGISVQPHCAAPWKKACTKKTASMCAM